VLPVIDSLHDISKLCDHLLISCRPSNCRAIILRQVARALPFGRDYVLFPLLDVD
jgi:hypothetical protein